MRRRRTRAYTLIEVLITVALILLLAAMTLWVLAKILKFVRSFAKDPSATRSMAVVRDFERA